MRKQRRARGPAVLIGVAVGLSAGLLAGVTALVAPNEDDATLGRSPAQSPPAQSAPAQSAPARPAPLPPTTVAPEPLPPVTPDPAPAPEPAPAPVEASPVAATPAEPPPVIWQPPLQPAGDDLNVRAVPGGLQIQDTAPPPAPAGSIEQTQPHGNLITETHTLPEPVSGVVVTVDADVPDGTRLAVDVRGQRADGSWTEWVPAVGSEPVRWDTPLTVVQVRLTMEGGPDGATPTVRSVGVSPDPAAVPVIKPREAATYRVFATREGLVGGTTANGHLIVERDHFVALPSRRGLSPKGTGDYTVKVCAENGRCEFAPVWDVGPWNTRDDYWNPPGIRQEWGDLPIGKPQAQAARQDGYNGGMDQFGRMVSNPAGIDLADGTFWDGLGLVDNSWVDVTYLWTNTARTAAVETVLLNVRQGPSQDTPIVGIAAKQAHIPVECSTTGKEVTGAKGTTTEWLRIGPDQYISAAHVASPGGVPAC